jgi:hypothetical protein
MEDRNEGIISFDDMSRELLQTFNPNNAKEQAKEMIANLLLMTGVPFFMERLKEKLPAELFGKLQEIVKDPQNITKNATKVASELFNDKIVQPLKGQLLKQMDEYIPALKELNDIDLSKLSLKDVQDLFTKQLIQKMKANLPPEIASKLPENFTQEDILNSLKDLSKDQALKFAKDNLPPEAYNMLEQNQDIVTDPTKLSNFMKGKFDEVSSKLSDTVSEFKSQAYSRLNEIKNSIKDEIDKNVQPFKDKIEELKRTKQSLADQLKEGKQSIQDRYDDLADRLRQMKTNNPNYTAEDIQPFRDARDALRQEAENLKAKSAQDLNDVDSQITDNTSTIDDITNNLVQKAYNLRQTLTSTANKVVDKGKETFQQGVQKGQELQRKAEQTVQDAKDGADALEAEARGTTQKAVNTLQRQAPKSRAFVPDEEELTTEPSEGILTGLQRRIGSFLGFKKTPTEPLLTTDKPSIQYTMGSPDELETSFSERALDTSNNKFLLRYRAMENSDITLDDNNAVRFAQYKPAPRETFAQRRLRRQQAEMETSEQPEATEQPKPIVSQQPEVTEQPTFNPEAQARAQQLRVETGKQGTRIPEPQQVLPTQPQRPPPSLQTSEIEPAPSAPSAPTQPSVDLGTQAPKPTTSTPAIELGEQAEGETFGSSIQKLSSFVQNAASKSLDVLDTTKQALTKKLDTSVVGAIDETAAATEEVPVLDVVMDLAGLFGTIFGAKALMKEDQGPPPIAEGTSYEPDL